MIIHIDASRALEPQPTGVNVYTREIIEHLVLCAAPDTQFILYAPEWTKKNVPEFLKKFENDSRVTWKFLRWPPKFLWTQICLAWAWARAEKKDSVFFAPAHVAPFFTPRNTVVVIHDIAFEFLPDAFSWRERMFARFMTRVNARVAKKILVPSIETRDQLIARIKVPAEKIIVTPFALPCDAIKLSGEKLDRPPFILSVGRIEYKKGPDILIRAFETLRSCGREIELVFVGKPGIGFETVDRLIQHSPYKQFIHVLGFVPDLGAFYASARVLALPTRYEGFGFNFLEGMAVGVPVVGMSRGSVAEVAGDGVTLANDEKEFTDLLDRAISDDAFRADLISRGAERVKLFTWEKTAATTLDVLAKL
ncbi:MAG: glycosyltransferase family 1 protein [Candidatus Magasanikbacteria bacterium]|nr:glycosyltransferase family 1 protein [Candidatus Magasanikbacteria bacterium]